MKYINFFLQNRRVERVLIKHISSIIMSSTNTGPAPPNAGYEPPPWAGKPSVGLHLDVMKETKLVQKLMVDEKSYYLFGRNPQMTDFPIDHGSCSRVHAALLWHKSLDRSFLVDLGSSK